MIKYRYALTGAKGIVDINDLTSDDRKVLSPFICLGCNGELKATLGGSKRATKFFSHKSTAECNGESYLHRLAKKVIVDAAENGKHLLLPTLEGSHADTDLFGEEHSDNWQLPKGSLTKFTAVEEQRIGSQVVDVLCTTDEGEQIAVEIFYTHAKSDEDIDKFVSSDLNSIEIDIGVLEFDVELSDLEEYVLRTPHNRTWLHPKDESSLIANSKKSLKDKIQSTNQFKVDSLRTWLKESIDFNENRWLVLPKVKATKTKKDLLGNEIRATATAPLKLTKILHDFEECCSNVFKASLEINERTIVPAYFAPTTEVNKVSDANSHLLVSFSAVPDGIEESPFEAKWVNIPKWKERVNAIAEQKIANKRGEYDNYIKGFSGATTEQKVKHLCKRLSINEPTYRCKNSKFSDEWNTVGYVWKLLIYVFYFKRYDDINIESLVKSDWLVALLDLPLDHASTEKRKIAVATWIKYKLYKVGFVEHYRGTKYSVDDTHSLRHGIKNIYDIL